MLNYHEYEKAVYQSFLEKRNEDNQYNFSVRRKGTKAAQRDYFIGTEKSNYFGTTLWDIPVSYPGSSSDLIDIFYFYVDDRGYGYYIEFNQTRDPRNEQNQHALNLIRSIEAQIENRIGLIANSSEKNKMLTYKTKSRVPFYTSVDTLMVDVFKDLEIIIPIVDSEIERIKSQNPNFTANHWSDKQFDEMQAKLAKRIKKYQPQDPTPKLQDTPRSKAKEERDSGPLNQILFGPPGTGKTYHTINEALKIVGVDISAWSRAQIKEEFDKRQKAGQIAFTTFHQSMSYEEFIEGIKPIEPDKEGVSVIYRVEPGLFKKLSIEASFDLATLSKSKETAETLEFSNQYDLFVEDVQERLLNNDEVKLETKSGGTVLVDGISEQGNVIIKHHNGTRTYTVSKPRLNKLQSAIDSLDEVSNINDEFRAIIGGSNSSAYWSVLNAIKQSTQNLSRSVKQKTYTYDDKVEVVRKMTKKDFQGAKGKSYVLIIDEINRGNVSQIFGELITLIEEDKRLGRDESLEAILPYSKEKFGIPPNLHIIGTMNTADRSVEALDTALRRRFSFKEMLPLYDLEGLDYQYAGIQGAEILKTINKRIEKLLDRDHLIGHSYLLLNEEERDKLESFLQNAFYNNIIPLLQEYFYRDYAKIGAVLGKGFIQLVDDVVQSEFASGFEIDDFMEREIHQIIDYRPGQPGNDFIQEGMTFEKAIRLLMNKTID